MWLKLGAAEGGTVAALAIGTTGASGARTLYIGSKVGVFRSAGLIGVTELRWVRLRQAPIGAMSLAASPSFAEDRTVAAGAESAIFVSVDAGDTWREAQLPPSRSMVLALCFSPNYDADGMIVAATLRDGIWASYDRGAHWVTRSFGLLDSTVFCLAASPGFARDETFFAGTESAIYMSYNGARAWKHLPFPEDNTPVLSLALSADFESDRSVFAGTESHGLLRSTDRGIHWQRLSVPADSVGALHATVGGLLAATDAGIFRSTDLGQTWHCLIGTPGLISLAAEGGLVVAGGVEQGAWAAAGDLADWQPLPVPPVRSMLGMQLSPAWTCDGQAFMYGPQEGVWRTDNGGITWQPIGSDSLPDSDVRALAISPLFANDHTVVAATAAGLFLSRDAGDTWQQQAEGPVGALAFSPGGELFAVIEDGVCVSHSLGQDWEKIPGPWDTGGQVLALAATDETDEARLHVALLGGADDSLSLWYGRAGNATRVLHLPGMPNPLISFWVPSGAGDRWYASVGGRVFTFDGASATGEDSIPAGVALPEDIITLTGARTEAEQELFACTSRHLYASAEARTWSLLHNFDDDNPNAETVVAFALSPAFPADARGYALLLGGTFTQLRLG